ncbi:MAG: GNAT family N-acetyltransferase [Flavobacteriaceae bacterium]
MNTVEIHLRALEPEDLLALEKIENDSAYWKYSNQTEPFSRVLLNQFIREQQQDIFQVRQKRFVISNQDKILLGCIDLFDFEPLHRRAGVGLYLLQEYRNKGIGSKALGLLAEYAKNILQLKTLYANIAIENMASKSLFQSAGFNQSGLKKEWNFYQGEFHDEYLYQKTL